MGYMPVRCRWTTVAVGVPQPVFLRVSSVPGPRGETGPTGSTGSQGVPGPNLVTINGTPVVGGTAGHLLAVIDNKAGLVNPNTFAKVATANTFTALQTFNEGISVTGTLLLNEQPVSTQALSAGDEITIASNTVRVHQPTAFSFTNVVNALAGAVVTSNTITLAGPARHYPVSVSGDNSPELSINGGAWTNGRVPAAVARPGDTIRVRLTAGAPLATRSATVLVGEYSMNWTVTSGAWSPTILGSGLVIGANVGLSRDQNQLWQDAGKTVQATAAGHPVRVMVCPFSGLEWSTESDSRRPILQQNGSGKWYLLPDSIDDMMTATSGTNLATSDLEWHYAIHSTESSVTQSYTTLSLLATSVLIGQNNDHGIMTLDRRYGLLGSVAHMGGAVSRPAGVGVEGFARIASSNSWAFYGDGATTVAGTSTPSWTSNGNDGVARVWRLGNFRQTWLPPIYGLVACSRAMTNDERVQLVAYLQGLYT